MQTIQRWKDSENEHKWKRFGVKSKIRICLTCNLSRLVKKEREAFSSKSFLPSFPEKPIQLQWPVRINYVLEELMKKSRLAKDVTEYYQETEEKKRFW